MSAETNDSRTNASEPAPLKIGSETDVGRERSENQDAVGYFKTADGRWTLLMVCDGLGGHAGGHTASTMAVEVISQIFRARVDDEPVPDTLRAAIEEANQAIHKKAQQDPTLRGMGTTCALLATDGRQVFVAHVGDSRVYRIRGEVITQLTRDHSTVQRLVDEGFMTSEEAKNHPNANLLARCLGPDPVVEVEVHKPLLLLPGDRYLLCSDGLYNMVEEPIIAALATMYPAPTATKKLVSLANDRGGLDNISVQILHRTDGSPATGQFDADRFRVETPLSPREQASTTSNSNRPPPDKDDSPHHHRDNRVPNPGPARKRSRRKPPLLLGALLIIGTVVLATWTSHQRDTGSSSLEVSNVSPTISSDHRATPPKTEQAPAQRTLDPGRAPESPQPDHGNDQSNPGHGSPTPTSDHTRKTPTPTNLDQPTTASTDRDTPR